MLPGGASDLTLDGGQALRLAAAVALAVLGLVTLPDLFRTPEPPPIPADVGFRPGETASVAPLPPKVPPPSGSKEERKVKGKGEPERSSQPPERRKKRERTGRERAEVPSPTPSAGAGAPQPLPAPAPPAYLPPPAPLPAPAVPADGTEEFAPGRASG